MHKRELFLVAITMAFMISACSNSEQPSTGESSAMEADGISSGETNTNESAEDAAIRKFSVSIGVLSGSEIHDAVSGLNQEKFDKGFQDGFSLQKPAYEEAVLSEELSNLEKHTNAAKQAGEEKPAPYDAKKEAVAPLSYALGYIRGSQVSQFAPELQKEHFLDSFAEAYQSAPENTNQAREEVRQYIESNQQRVAAERDKQSATNLDISAKFLQDNTAKEGVVTTESGLQYVVLQDASGDSLKKPKSTDTVEVHYEGKLLDDTVFDSSYQRNQTATFPLNGVISGWTEGLQYMSIGSKFRFFIPPELAYGIEGSGNRIGPNELLIFDVELISIQ